jgi:hypothetical protein
MSIRYAMPKHGVRISSTRGEVNVWMETPTLLMLTHYGYLSPEMGDSFVSAAKRITANARTFTVAADCFDVLTYHPNYRLKITDWLRQNQDRIVANHVYSRSRMVQLAVSVVNLVLRKQIALHRNIEDFERVLLDARADALVHSRRATAIAS